MKSGKAGKMATALTVLLLVLSGLVVVQWNAQSVEATEDSAYTYTVEGFLDADVSIESDLDIKLRDLSTGELRTRETNEDFYEFSDVRPGWYEIIFPSQLVDGIAYMSTSTELRVRSSETEDIMIDAEEADEMVDGYIWDEDGEAIENATVTLEDKERGFSHSVKTETEIENNETVSRYEMEIYGDFSGLLKVEKEGYAPYVNPDFSIVEEQYYDLTVDVEGNGTVEVDGEVVDDEWTKEYEESTEVDLTAVPDEGWYFQEWTGDYTGAEENITVEMDEDKEVVANFAEEVETYELTINYNETRGVVEVDGDEVSDGWTEEYDEGTEVGLEAIAADDYTFENWTVDGNHYADDNETDITMNEDKEVVANFAEEVETYELTINYNETRGVVEVDGDEVSDGWTEEYDEGTEVGLEAIAEDDYTFENWTVDGDHYADDNETDITMNEDKEVVANFAEEVETYEFTINYNETRGVVEVDGDEVSDGWTEEYDEGTEVGLEAIAEDDYTFENWTVDGDHYADDNETDMTMDEDKEVTANFEEETVYTTMEDDDSYDVILYPEPTIEGRLVDDEGKAVREDLDITIHNEDLGIFQATDSGPTFRIRAPAGYDYTLVVDAPGFEPLVEEVEDLEKIERLGKREVVESVPEEFEHNLEFEEDFDTLNVHTVRTLNSATRMKTLDFSHVGNLRMQIDLTLGDGDGYVSEDEAERFMERLEYSEADIPTTYGFITVNDTMYELKDYQFEYDDAVETLEGPVTEVFEEIEVSATTEYAAESIEDVGQSEDELINLTVQHDYIYGNERDFTYTLNLPEERERYIGEGSAESIPENVEVEGYTSIDISPGENYERTSDLVFDVRESKRGELEIILEREPWIYEHEDKENYTDFVIRKDTEAEIVAQYENPISHVMNYTWWLNDEEIKSGEDASELTYAFNDTGEKTLEVRVEESNRNETSDQITIMVDDEGPQGENIVVDGEPIEIGGTATVDENTDVYFNASAFEDAATGMVSNYEWNFTDVNETRSGTNMTNVSHTFTIPGTHDVILNVTDPVGNWNEVDISVKVNDTTDPMVIIKAEWDDRVSEDREIEVEKDTTVTFNGTGSRAHEEYEGNLTFEWEIEELGEDGTGAYFDHTFEEVEEYTVILYATDEAGNTANRTMIVNTLRGPTPNLRVSDLTFSTRDIRVGDDVSITVNITNDGDKNATQLNPVLRVDGDIVDISPRYYRDYEAYQEGEELNVTRIEPEERVTMALEWTPENDGEQTLTLNVTDDDEPSDLYWNNELEDTLTVDPAAWREYIVYALIPIIIIGVTVGLYFYKDKVKDMLGR